MAWKRSQQSHLKEKNKQAKKKASRTWKMACEKGARRDQVTARIREQWQCMPEGAPWRTLLDRPSRIIKHNKRTVYTLTYSGTLMITYTFVTWQSGVLRSASASEATQQRPSLMS
jgi:hypothetical protein